MRHGGKWTATHWYLLALTVAFCTAAAYICWTAPQPPQGSYEVATQRGSAAEEPEKIDLNTASAEELETLRGIGPVLAGRIVEYRTAHGPYTAPEDLLAVEGIGEKTVQEIRDYVTWEGGHEDTGGG